MEDSIIVIQCAAGKQPTAAHLKSSDGRKVMFVANPGLAPANPDCVYARPDDLANSGVSWRQELQRYNQGRASDNPLELLPAWRLYRNPPYELLYDQCGPENLYVLSAGWGLIQADFLTPNYDITFSSSAEKYKRRRRREAYDDFRMLPHSAAKPVVFFGGKDYVSLFCELSSQVRGQRHIIYNSAKPPSAPGCQLHRFETRARTNWHYAAARAYIEGLIDIYESIR